MYKERWAIESFFRWIKQNLNVPVLFGTTKNAVFSQLFSALIAYVLLKLIFHSPTFKHPLLIGLRNELYFLLYRKTKNMKPLTDSFTS